jgi:hypothetical protein
MVEDEELEAIARRVIDSLFSSRESAARVPVVGRNQAAVGVGARACHGSLVATNGLRL